MKIDEAIARVAPASFLPASTRAATHP